MARARPAAPLTVFYPRGSTGSFGPSSRALRQPDLRFAGRHALFPLAVRRSGADVYWSPAGLLPLGPLGMPAAITVHDLAIYRHPEWFPPGQWLSTRVVVPRSIRRAGAIIAVSESTARDLKDLFGVERVSVVHHGVGSEFRPLHPSELGEIRGRLRLPDRFILFLSTIEPRKNLETLLDAWSGLPDAPQLVVAGGWGWRTEGIRAKLDSMARRPQLLGPVAPEDLPALYSAAVCLAHPAWYEGFGLTPLEAMACGTPVVCSNASSLPEVVGDAALTVDPGDGLALREALKRLTGDGELRAELGRRGLERAAGYTWERAAEATWRVLESLPAR